jgi:ATP/maltotriose-dependent transcriptional regulator MalT
MMGDVAGAIAAAEESQSLMREKEDRRWLLLSLPVLAGIEYRKGNQAKAKQLRQEISQILEKVDHTVYLPIFLGLGSQARLEGRTSEAQAYFRRGLEIAQKVRSKLFVMVMESELAHLTRRSGDLRRAKEAYCELILKWKDFGQLAAVAHQLECFAFIAQHEGEAERAARLLGVAEALREIINAPMREDEQVEYEKEIASLRVKIDAAVFAAAWSEGRAMDLERAIGYAVTH